MSRLGFYVSCINLHTCILFYLATIPASCLNNETDLQALMAFKNAIVVDPQGTLSSWNETVHFCSWPGISCSHKHQDRVSEINLMSRGLLGTISPYLGNLSFLHIIILKNNSFYSPIPDEIGRLRRLEHVSFSNDSLSGEITRNLSNCVRIYHLDLIDNHFTGIIPPELSSLVNLQALGLSRNQLSGAIPPFIGNFTSLSVLSIGECGMQGEIPESLVQLKSLKLLYLAANYNLTGTIPSGLFNISTMLIFDMNSNKLEGTIPSQIGFSFSRFTWLNLYSNQFSGEIPITLSNYSSLEKLYLSSNSFSGQVLIDFRRLSALSALQLQNNNLEGDLSFISTMINCTELQVLQVGGNSLSGLLPYSIANLSSGHLSFLDLNKNHIRESIPPGIGNLRNLHQLYLFSNDLTGPVPSEIGKLNNLQLVELQQNNLAGLIPPIFDNMTFLTLLHLGQNNFSGNIPRGLNNCSSLLALDISNNFLNGEIPPDIMSKPSILIYLNLGQNSLTGSIPSEFGLLVNLLDLSLSSNRLSGNLPYSLSSCIALEQVFLQNNLFSGEIPDGLRNLRSLQYLDASQNNLSGAIPKDLGGLLYLTYLNLSFNKLEGEIPTTGVFLNQSAISLEGNSELCGGIPSLSFPPCSSQRSKKNHFPRLLKILIPVLSIVSIASLCYYIFLYKGRKSKNSRSSMVQLETDHLRLSYGDLLKSTGGFSELNLLGAGRFGSVYKGILENPQTSVAVKVLNLNIRGAAKSLISECNALRGARHRNLVKIVSVCSSTDFKGNDFKALVYEYMVNGDLYKWLHQNSSDETGTMSLRQRLNIAIDIASGLEAEDKVLMSSCSSTDSTIVHGDLKPSNILLDEDMTAHVSDFGLAKVISDILSTDESNSLGIRGTIGYIPPEYGLSGIVSTEGDVYSYGILLLEMFTGKRPTNDDPNDSPSLRDLVRTGLQSQVMDVIDPVILLHEHNHRLNDEAMNCIISFLEIGLACSNELPRDRMLMNDVVNGLRKTVHMAQ